MSRRTGKGAVIVLAALASLTTACIGAAPTSRSSAEYDVAATTRWREERAASLRAPEGWLSVAGLFFLEPGANTVGSAPGNDIVLPARAPASAGVITFDPAHPVTFDLAPGVAAHDGKAVRTGRVEFLPVDPATKRPPSRYAIDGVTLQLHRSGSRVAIRLRDPESPLRTGFQGLRWYEIDQAWRLEGRFVPRPQTLTTYNILGDSLQTNSPGEAEFELDGQTIRLVAYTENDKLWFVFSDATRGRETYGTRFLLAEQPDAQGRVVLDFNRTYNPPCAYNPHTTCPVPLPQNKLTARIPAGEKLYVGEDHGRATKS